MRSILWYLTGHKTYVASSALILGVGLAIFLGWLAPAQALPFLAIAGFAFGFRSVLEKHHDEVLALLFAIAESGIAFREHDKQALATAAGAAVQDGEALATEIHEEEKQS